MSADTPQPNPPPEPQPPQGKPGAEAQPLQPREHPEPRLVELKPSPGPPGPPPKDVGGGAGHGEGEPGKAQPQSRKRSGFPWPLVGALLCVLVIAGLVITGLVSRRRLLAELREVRAEREQLAQPDPTLERRAEELQELKQELARLILEQDQLGADRENLLAQIRIAQEERNEARGQGPDDNQWPGIA